MTCPGPSLGGSLGLEPRFVSLKASAFYSLKYRNQGLIAKAGQRRARWCSPQWHPAPGLTGALGRCVLATEVLVILIFASLWGNRTEDLKLGQSLAVQAM